MVMVISFKNYKWIVDDKCIVLYIGNMLVADQPDVDPRIRRTRVLLQDALFILLKSKPFESITVQDITTEATVSRATFYSHYVDKHDLLNGMTDARFQSLLNERGVSFDGTCESALRAILLGVCDYLRSVVDSGGPDRQAIDPYLETAVIAVVNRMSEEGLKQQTAWHGILSLEMIATTVSWALYGAARNWVYTPARPPAESIADDIVAMLTLLIHPPAQPSQSSTRHN
jgi:AcrR family transcriptional regulator